jgi:hypothetical protein
MFGVGAAGVGNVVIGQRDRIQARFGCNLATFIGEDDMCGCGADGADSTI